MKLKELNSNQKLRGAYYTPNDLAAKIVDFFDFKEISSILEPSCGDGVFVDAVFDRGLLNGHRVLTAIEIESSEAKKVHCRYKDSPNISVVCDDFLNYYETNKENVKFDLILGNPPYIRYQYLSSKQRVWLSKIIEENGMKPNKLINAWVCFLVACTKLLSNRGKIAFVIPAELLQVAYAEDLRFFLSNQFAKITLFTFEKLIFPDIEQEVVVFVGEKGKEEEGIRIVEMHDVNNFRNASLRSNTFIPLQHVKEKWTRYFTSPEEIKLIQILKDDKRFKKFSEFGTINVGITTGDNSYFSIDSSTEKKYGLTKALLPLIGRSSHAHGIYFTREDWERNKKSGKKSQLLYFPNTPYEKYPSGYKSYIQKGVDSEINNGYKCKIRDRWYIIPSVWIPDAFFLRRNNLYPKFVLNRCNAVSTDTMHRIKFNEGVNPELVLLSYYNSISFAFSEICGRSYGGGVLEILPSEMGNILLPVLCSFPKKKMDSILKKIDGVVRNEKNIEEALDLVDNEILIKTLGVDASICQQARCIWKKMQQRRLGRN